MSTFLPTLLTWLQQYGYPMLWIYICIAAIGVPLPVSLVLLAAGALAALGDFNIVLLALVAITASTCGDSVGYGLGWRIGTPVLDWLVRQGRVRFVTAQRLATAHDYFERRGAWAIFLSRFLFSALGGVINLVAGAERYSYRRFLFFDVVGEIVGALIPLVLGYSFGASWEAVGNIMGAISGLAIVLLGVIVLLVQLVKMTMTRTTYSNVSSTKRRIFSISVVMPKSLLPQQTFLREDAPPEPLLP